jgi:hypothetical protein
MKIKNEYGEKVLVFCSWQNANKCKDKGMTNEEALRIIDKMNENLRDDEQIRGISHGICVECLNVLDID